jgi:hypothetical protein
VSNIRFKSPCSAISPNKDARRRTVCNNRRISGPHRQSMATHIQQCTKSEAEHLQNLWQKQVTLCNSCRSCSTASMTSHSKLSSLELPVVTCCAELAPPPSRPLWPFSGTHRRRCSCFMTYVTLFFTRFSTETCSFHVFTQMAALCLLN